jgi:NAD(P)-dependent dehydrogenase (short-subunit alcohol dehydrogenase family)
MVVATESLDPYFSVAGLSILVAGGAGGLGAPLARVLSARRARVVIADVDADRARDLARELSATTGQAIAVPLDVVDGNSCAAAVDATVQQWGGLDGLVNASGIYRVAPALDLADADWERTLDINLTGAFRLARAAGNAMVAQGRGSIVTLASVSSTVANPNYAAYAASKAAIAHVTRVLAVEWAQRGVRVNALGPAVTPTPLAAPILADDASRAAALARIPMGRFGSPEDLVAAAIFLLSPGSSFVTGQTLYVDGGRSVS